MQVFKLTNSLQLKKKFRHVMWKKVDFGKKKLITKSAFWNLSSHALSSLWSRNANWARFGTDMSSTTEYLLNSNWLGTIFKRLKNCLGLKTELVTRTAFWKSYMQQSMGNHFGHQIAAQSQILFLCTKRILESGFNYSNFVARIRVLVVWV